LIIDRTERIYDGADC